MTSARLALPQWRDPARIWYIRRPNPKTEDDILQEKLADIEKRAALLEKGLYLPYIPDDVKELIRFAMEDLMILQRVFRENSGVQYLPVRKEILMQMNEAIRRLEDLKIIS